MALHIQFRNGTASAWTSANPTLLQGEPGAETDTGKFKIGDGTTAWTGLAYQGTTGPTQTATFKSFGDGSDGNVTVSSGTTTLVRDMFYNNLTISGTGNVFTNGFKVFVKGILDLRSAPAGALNANGGNGGNGSGTTGGAAGTSSGTGSVGLGGFAGAGANSSTAAGATGGAGSGNIAPNNGGTQGASAAGGAGTNAGGGGGTATGIQQPYPVRRYDSMLLAGASLINGGVGGKGGGSGGGDNTNVGGAGGGGGGGGGVLAIYANMILRGGSTAAGCIQANGGNGGNGGASAITGSNGGGGGGSGGGGGFIYLVYNYLIGSSVANGIQASGGSGGNGGSGTLFGGSGANGAMPGCITTYQVPTSVGSNFYGTESLIILPEMIGNNGIFFGIPGVGGVAGQLQAAL